MQYDYIQWIFSKALEWKWVRKSLTYTVLKNIHTGGLTMPMLPSNIYRYLRNAFFAQTTRVLDELQEWCELLTILKLYIFITWVLFVKWLLFYTNGSRRSINIDK